MIFGGPAAVQSQCKDSKKNEKTTCQKTLYQEEARRIVNADGKKEGFCFSCSLSFEPGYFILAHPIDSPESIVLKPEKKKLTDETMAVEKGHPDECWCSNYSAWFDERC